MTLGGPKDHILKVSCHYLYFQLSYSDLLIKLLTVGRETREERERRDSSDFSGCLAIATVGQKAVVRQGLPNIAMTLTKVYGHIFTIIILIINNCEQGQDICCGHHLGHCPYHHHRYMLNTEWAQLRLGF